jgi:hypothetical protein
LDFVIEGFDFGELYMPQTMLLRLGDVALFTVFDDSCGAMSYFWQKLEKITGRYLASNCEK